MPARATALTAGGVTEVTATEDQVTAVLAMIKSGALPADLRTALRALGVSGADLKRLRAGVLTQTRILRIRTGSERTLEGLGGSQGAQARDFPAVEVREARAAIR